MKERPILFSAAMVRALLAGTKTQTRRVVKRALTSDHHWQAMHGTSPDGFRFGDWNLWREVGSDYPDSEEDDLPCPYGAPGDRLWVRETWRAEELKAAWVSGVSEDVPVGSDGVRFRADHAFRIIENTQEASGAWGRANRPGLVDACGWRPSIFMPRWASRITLEVVAVRVERLQSITEADARAEGIEAIVERAGNVGVSGYRLEGCSGKDLRNDPRDVYRSLWEPITGAGSWAADPFVWVVEFKVLP
jgi:hypothetical protein